MEIFEYNEPFRMECGVELPGLQIAFHRYGYQDPKGKKVAWICHALTANSEAEDWWKGLVGKGSFFDPDEYYIICANILGSCYGSSGPLSRNPVTGTAYFSEFPLVTIRDMVRAHILLRKYLVIPYIDLLMGGSMGGYQALEWAFMENDRIGSLFLTATSARESAWGIAIHSAQRLAIEADCSWKDMQPHAGKMGLKAARAMGILSYRNYGLLVEKQTDPDPDKTDGFKASSYIDHQGEKLTTRFNAYSYWLLTKSMDSHSISRGRGLNASAVLSQLPQPTLLIGINSDILCPMEEMRFLNANIPNSILIEIDSAYGHDGFLVETDSISSHLKQWMQKK